MIWSNLGDLFLCYLFILYISKGFESVSWVEIFIDWERVLMNSVGSHWQTSGSEQQMLTSQQGLYERSEDLWFTL